MNAYKTLNSEDSSKERQDNELLSITSIFPNEVKDLRENDVWKSWRPLELQITLTPEVSVSMNTETNIQADLYVKCTQDYPNEVPTIDIKNTKGVSNKDAIQLKIELHNVAKRCLGEEMILELIYYVRAFLRNHGKPQYKSFYEEMMHNKLKQQKEIEEQLEKEKEAQKLIEEKKLMAIEQERNRKLEALKEASRRSRNPECAASCNIAIECSNFKSSPVNRQRSASEPTCKEICANTIKKTLKFSGKTQLEIFCGQCINHNRKGYVVYYGIDIMSGNFFAIIKWTFQWSFSSKNKIDLDTVKKEQSECMKQIASIEQEFKTLRQLNHNNLVHYVGMSCEQKKDKIVVFIAQEYIPGCTLAQMFKGIPLSIQQLQVYTRGLLEAIQYLHESSVVHKNIRDTSVFINNIGQLKLADYSIDKKLYDLNRSLTKENEVDHYPPTMGKGGKKGDIYRLGIILLSASTGQIVRDTIPNIPQSLNPVFRDFLNKCLTIDEHQRWSADQLLLHPFLAFSSFPSFLSKDIENKVEKNNVTDELPTINKEVIAGSRLSSEFEVLQCLGKGGFGYVLKVKNKLDSRIYALKQIPLNSTEKQLDRKIKREVKVLSKLNHENIVRYYNSWIEETYIEEASNDESKDSTLSEHDTKIVLNNIVAHSAASSSVQWEMHDNKEDIFSSDEDECDDFSMLYEPEKSLSVDIEFVDDSQITKEISEENTTPDKTVSAKSLDKKKTRKVQRFMYIQMEFCEKSTLRTAIDNNLYKDVPLVWRLFREIIEGLNHIHQQGVIHRDLKPVNIFLDSKDHVKIGDFGLATDVISKPTFEISFPNESHSILTSSDTAGDGMRTGNVGTALYVAPEVAASTQKQKLNYSQKIDIYSLGIIFFEMCYPTPSTAMERVKLLMSIRDTNIILPKDSDKVLSKEMIYIINWLLQHDPNQRPTSAELISSDYIPPLLMEEAELNNALRNTVSNPQSRTFKYMIDTLFKQEVSAEFDHTYNTGLKGHSLRNKPYSVFSDVVDTLNRIMKKHGAIHFSVPTLMPKCAVYDNERCVHLMDHGGGLVSLPHDLRVPFARYVALKDINQLKRFALEKVYQEQLVFGLHPRENYEYAFDIVTSSKGCSISDAEILYVISEVISEFPSLEHKNFYIRLNYVSLLKAVILYSGVDKTLEAKVCQILGDQKNRGASKVHLQNLLLNLKLSDKTIKELFQFIEIEDTVDRVTSLCQPVLQSKDKIGSLAKEGLKELKNVLKIIKELEIKLPILICPGLAYETKVFSGMIFQCVCHSKMKKKMFDILAAGGRYDKLIASFKLKGTSDTLKGVSQSAVGVSFAVERIISAEIEFNENTSSGVVDFLVHALEPEMNSYKISILKELWSSDVSATVMYDEHVSIDEAIDFCRENRITHILILSKFEPGLIKVRSLEKDKVFERKVCHSELKELLMKVNAKSLSDSLQPIKSESKSNLIQNTSSGNLYSSVKFLPQDKSHNNRKREPNIRSHILSNLQPTSRSWEIFAVDLKMPVICCIISHCDINCDSSTIYQSFTNVIDEYPKYKKYLLQLSDEICDIRNKKPSCAVILYSLPDNNFRIIL